MKAIQKLIFGLILYGLTSCGAIQSLGLSKSSSEANPILPHHSILSNPQVVTIDNVDTSLVYTEKKIKMKEIVVMKWDDNQRKYYDFQNELLRQAETFLGIPYRYGGTSRRGIDCSSFVQQSYLNQYSLPRTARYQATLGRKIKRKDLQKGDLVFFATRGGRSISHVGILHHFDENDIPYFIHASSSQGVTVTSLNNSYWSPRFLFAKRLLDETSFNTKMLNTEITVKQDSIFDLENS